MIEGRIDPPDIDFEHHPECPQHEDQSHQVCVKCNKTIDLDSEVCFKCSITLMEYTDNYPEAMSVAKDTTECFCEQLKDEADGARADDIYSGMKEEGRV